MDVNVMRRVVAGVLTPTDAQLAAGDLDGDGAVNGIDANALARIISGVN